MSEFAAVGRKPADTSGTAHRSESTSPYKGKADASGAAVVHARPAAKEPPSKPQKMKEALDSLHRAVLQAEPNPVTVLTSARNVLLVMHGVDAETYRSGNFHPKDSEVAKNIKSIVDQANPTVREALEVALDRARTQFLHNDWIQLNSLYSKANSEPERQLVLFSVFAQNVRENTRNWVTARHGVDEYVRTTQSRPCITDHRLEEVRTGSGLLPQVASFLIGHMTNDSYQRDEK